MATFSQDAPFQAPHCLPENNRKLLHCTPSEQNPMVSTSPKLSLTPTGSMCIPSTKAPGRNMFEGGVYSALPPGQTYSAVHCNKYPVGMGPAVSSAQQCETFVTVPFGWKRVINKGKVTYISPSEVYLHSLQEASIYLQTEGTCKCGLECPLMLNKVFNFNPLAATKSWSVNDLSWNDPTKICNHKRKLAALATFQNSTFSTPSLSSSKEANPLTTPPPIKKETTLANKKKRVKGKNRSPFDSVLVSQLLAQRDKLGQKKDKPGATKTSFSNTTNQQIRTQNAHKNEGSEQKKGPAKTVGFVLEEQNAMNKMNNFSNLHLNQNFYVSENIFQDKKGCIQSFQQDNPSVMFHKHMNSPLPCEPITNQNSDAVYTDRVPPLPSIDNQTFGPMVNQGMFNQQQLLPNGTNITLNCNFSTSSVNGQLFSTQLPVNTCIDMNPHSQGTTDMVTAVSQSPTPGAFIFPNELQTHTNQQMNNNLMTNFIQTGCGQSFNTNLQDGQHVASPNLITSKHIPSRDASPLSSRQKPKKTSRAKSNKINSVLDRGSPCPNIDVRQIPSEHHRPPPEAFAAISSTTLGPIQNTNYQTMTGSNVPFPPDLSCMKQPFPNMTGHNLPPRTVSQNTSFYDANKTPDSIGSNNSSPFQNCHNLGKNLQFNSFQLQDQIQVSQANASFLICESNKNLSKMNFQNINNKVSLANQISSSQSGMATNVQSTKATSGNLSRTHTPDNSQNIENRNSPFISNLYNASKNSQNFDSRPSSTVSSTVYLPVSNVSSTCPSTSVMMSVSLSNTPPNVVNVLSNSNSFYTNCSQSNIINIPVSYASQQSHLNNPNTVYSNQNMPPNSQQIRQNVPLVQQPMMYTNSIQNSANQRNNQAANYFMQNPNSSGLEGMTGLRPSLVQQDGSNMLVQQVLSQKITSDYSTANIFQSTARAQVVQQMSGMVLPASASNQQVNPQQLVLAPTQMRMSSSGGLITMLPSTMTSNGMMNGTQVLTANGQQIGHQMVLSDGIRPNIVNQQQILQNNCFIMSNQPTFVTRPPSTNIVNCQVPCPTSVSFSNGNYCNSQNNTNCTPIIAAPLMHKAQDRNDLHSQQVTSDMPLQNNKDQVFPAGFHILQSTPQRLPGQKINGSDMGNENWIPKSEFKNEAINQISGPFLSNVSTSRSNSVPSNMSGHAMISNCGQVLINNDNNNGMQPQSIGTSNLSRMTNVIPIVGGQCALNSPMPPMSVPNVTAVTTTMTQMIPAIGIAPQILGQPVQPMVQVINTVPFNSMQNAVLVPGGSNVLSQTVRLDTLQTSPVVGAPGQTVFNGVVIPPNPMNCIPSPAANVSSLRLPHPGNHSDEMRVTFENLHEARGGSNSSCSTPASSCSSTPISSSSDTHNMTYRALSPAVRKRSRDGKRKTNSQTVASMLQHGTHNLSPSNASNTNSVSQQQQQHQQQQNAAQLSSLQQQFLQPPMLQTLTVLPQQSRPLLQQPVMNYNSIGSVNGHQILTTNLASPLGIVQPLSMLGVTPTGAIIQNIPVQQVVQGPHFQPLSVLQGHHTVNSLPQEQPMVVNDTSSMGVHPTQMHSAFAAGSIVPNMVTTNPVINTHVGGTEVLVTATSQSHAVTENVRQSPITNQYPSVFQQALPPIAQSLSSTTSGGGIKLSRSNNTNVSATCSFQTSISSSFLSSTSTCNNINTENKGDNTKSKGNSFVESKHKARSIGVQSGSSEQNTAVQTVTSSTIAGKNSAMTNSHEYSPNTKAFLPDTCGEDIKSKFENENSSTLLSSGGESCESPWPDPVNLSAAVRAVVQEQADSNEEIISQPIRGSNPMVNFLDCTSIHADTSEQTPTSSVEDNVEESNDANSVLDLRTMSVETSTDQDISDEAQENNMLQLNNWSGNGLPPETTSDHVAESTSTASSESSEPTSTDCNVTSDSGVESSQEPMNLACIREGGNIMDSDLTVPVSEVVLNPYNNGPDELAKKRGLKRLHREIDVVYENMQGEESDDSTLSPPLPPQPRTFNDGDLVWGQIRGFPSWPGKLVREDEVKNAQKSEDGKLWVRWFGDHTFTQVDPEKLKTLSEGLEAHHRARKRHRRGRKMNSQLENAIQEAMLELDRQSADLLSCEDTEEETEDPLESPTSSSRTSKVRKRR
ncbi:hypothetical protein JTE90_020283 [Oedothorax gibbosus]|uniref:Methyl-CpG-binding domain protein 5 n=1 Tax=Oedothorax gibbosus TaxID=931172 RepID=A0AAV6VPU5_9ARAC|nr:hypothetical protein JTE90_020283 [Oedothorax gibbosus]